MKKLLVFSIFVGFCTVAAFTENGVTITGSADAALVPLQMVSHDDNKDGTYVGAGLGRAGYSEGPIVKLNVTTDFEDTVGLKADLRFNKGVTYEDVFFVGDFLELWVKPLDWIKVDMGRFNEDRLRGKIRDDDWSNYTVGMGDNDDIFTRFKGDVGVLLGFDLKPIVEGLYIGVLFPEFAQMNSGITGGEGTANNSNLSSARKWRAANVYEQIQIALGYEIQGVGLVRAQFVGGKVKDHDYRVPRIEAAFAFTGVEDLVIDAGLKFWIPVSSFTGNDWNGNEYQKVDLPDNSMEPLQISAGAQYDMDALNIAGRADVTFLGKDLGVKIGPYVNFHLWPSYNLGFATVGLDFGLKMIGIGDVGGDTGLGFGLGAWLGKSFGNSSIRGGLAYNNNKSVHLGDRTDTTSFSIPILFDYVF